MKKQSGGIDLDKLNGRKSGDLFEISEMETV